MKSKSQKSQVYQSKNQIVFNPSQQNPKKISISQVCKSKSNNIENTMPTSSKQKKNMCNFMQPSVSR